MSPLLRSSRLAVLALAAATGAHAAELGDASVRSYAGQPLSAEIELTDLSAQELADLQVRLARPDVFQGANVKMQPALAGAAISIGKRDSHRVLRVTTTAPVQGEVLHLYFQLVSGGKERVRGVTLWLSPAPAAPAPVPVVAATALAAATPVPPAVRADKPAGHRAGSDTAARLVAIASPGKEATSGEREMLAAVERAFSARGGNVETREEKPARPVPSQKDVRREALKHASTADDFRRGTRPAKVAVAQHEAEKASEKAPEKALAAEPPEEKKAPARTILASKAELAEAARATRASVEAGIDGRSAGPGAGKGGAESAAPAKTAAAQPAAAQPQAQPDAAMLTKLAELEGKLKTLQAQLGISNTAGAATVAAPAAGATQPVAQVPEAARPTPAPVAAAAQHGATPAAPAADEAAKPAIAQHEEPAAEHVTTSAQATSAAAVATVEEPKPAPAEKKAKEPPPPEPKKEIKISRPKLLTFLFAGSMVLLAIFGVMVHFVRKAKMKRSPIVRQSWSRDEDDAPVRAEPTADPVPATGLAAPLKA